MSTFKLMFSLDTIACYPGPAGRWHSNEHLKGDCMEERLERELRRGIRAQGPKPGRQTPPTNL